MTEPYLFKSWDKQEHDACGILAYIRRDGVPTHQTINQTLEALTQLQHRAGFVGDEGDGCGILLDLPRNLWGERLTANGQDPALADSPAFVVGHFFIPKKMQAERVQWQEKVRDKVRSKGFSIVAEAMEAVNTQALGPRASKDEPLFWQIAALYGPDGLGNPGAWNSSATVTLPQMELATLNEILYDLQVEIEAESPVHVVSLSSESVVYKVRGSAATLGEYFSDLTDASCMATVAIGHNRYSTNTTTAFERVQPFSLLAHNGEINTIQRLREEAEMLGIPMIPDASDSQDLNRTLEALIRRYGWSIVEAMDLLFPPIINEIRKYPEPLQDLYLFYRHLWGPFAQGPAGVVAFQDRTVVASVDALGLRPLWLVQSREAIAVSSEPGIFRIHDMTDDPKPLAPGEKLAVRILDSNGYAPEVQVIDYPSLQQEALQRTLNRYPQMSAPVRPIPASSELNEGATEVEEANAEDGKISVSKALLAAWGWEIDDVRMAEQEAGNGAEPIGSLGYDGPLAALTQGNANLSDYFKETVAVVTNPAIDREREIEHFSTRTVLGERPPAHATPAVLHPQVELRIPLMLGGHHGEAPVSERAYRAMARSLETVMFEDFCAAFAEDIATFPMSMRPDETLPEALQRLASATCGAVREGREFLILTDGFDPEKGDLPIEAALAVACIDEALKHSVSQDGEQNLRRQCSLIVQAGSLRNLHDLVVHLGLGADALVPYLMYEVAAGAHGARGIENVVVAMQKGMEKVISTIGIHELRGYDRLFMSLGLQDEVAETMSVINSCGSKQAGLGWQKLIEQAQTRAEFMLSNDPKIRPERAFRLYPRIWKLAGDIANGIGDYETYARTLAEIEKESPVSLRHLLEVKPAGEPVDPSQVDIGIGHHDLPFNISSMSFGSQGEIAYRAYAEAAYRLNMLSLNGEGGEIKDLLGKYPDNRGIQVASGRFGISAELANAVNYLEIKIGQGAKPGEGGHLPGKKVSAKVAAARNARPGTDLISPSNNHDIYSIEDLFQIVEELKTANPNARVIVKVPIVPNIGTIAVGIAKAGADVVSLSGFDGGTGAARQHALRHVGLPVEYGVAEAHRALVEAGIRDEVEVWGDGGVKSAADVVKLMCLGANRCGFATLAMVAVGCTICRGCQTDTCHVGIATQVETIEEAKEKGLKKFTPRIFEMAVVNLVRFFEALGEGLRGEVARLGLQSAQELVGRADLLIQARGAERIDLARLIEPVPYRKPEPARQVPPVRKPHTQHSLAIMSKVEEALNQGLERVEYSEDHVINTSRVLGTSVAGLLTRRLYNGIPFERNQARLSFTGGSVVGNGFACFNVNGLDLVVHGGAQDGVAKAGFGGKVVILKARNSEGRWLYGSVGKSFAYGAMKGTFVVEGDADARAGIRLSGADLIFGGELREPVDDLRGTIASRANIKGFAFEYMTNGRAIVLGDPGPWICSGMTGGVVYLRLQPEMGLDQAALRRRLAKGAKVHMFQPGAQGIRDIREMLTTYLDILNEHGHAENAARVKRLLDAPEEHFMQIVPESMQTDPSISTE